MGQFELVRGDEEVNVRHRAKADVRIDEGGEMGAFEDGDFDAGGLEGSQHLREVVVEEGVASGVLEEGFAQNVEYGGGRFPWGKLRVKGWGLRIDRRDTLSYDRRQ